MRFDRVFLISSLLSTFRLQKMSPVPAHWATVATVAKDINIGQPGSLLIDNYLVHDQ